MGLDDEEEEGYFDEEDNQSYSFPPPLSEYEAADMSVQPGITVDKARTDLYIQFKKEFDAIRGMLAALPGEAGVGGEIGQEKIATLLLGPDSPVYRVFYDVLGLDFAMFSHFMATFYLTCRMSCNLTKLVEDDDINTDKYMDVEDFNEILHGMSEHGITDEFTPRTWQLLEDAHNKNMVKNFIQIMRTMKKLFGTGTISSEVKKDGTSYSNNSFTLRCRNFR